MAEMIWLVPLLPLLSSVLLMLGSASFPRLLIGSTGGWLRGQCCTFNNVHRLWIF